MDFCPNCGRPFAPADRYCGKCGSRRTVKPPSVVNTSQLIRQRLGSPAMLAFCVLMTLEVIITVGLCFLNLPQSILFIIVPLLAVPRLAAFWQIFSDARSEDKSMRLHGLRLLNTVTAIIRSLIWALAALLGVAGLVFIGMPSMIYELQDTFSGSFLEYLLVPFYGGFMLILCVVVLLLCTFYYGGIRTSVRSVLESMEKNENRLNKMSSVSTWLIVLCVLYASATVFATLRLFIEVLMDFDTYILLLLLFIIIHFVVMILGASLAGKLSRIRYIPSKPNVY